MNLLSNKKTYIVSFVLSFLVFFTMGASNFVPFSTLFENQDEYELNYKDNIKEVNLIFLGSSKCMYSNDDNLYEAIKNIKLKLNERYKNRKELGFSATGISVDWKPKEGIEYLEKFGQFNEIITGNSWSNHGVIRYVGEIGEEASTPQIFLILRTYSGTISSVIKEEERILTLTGRDKILQWYNEGIQMPSGL